MRNAIVAAASVLLAVSAASATQIAGNDGAPGERAVINSFASPGERPMGLVWRGSVLFHVDEARGDVYAVEPDGSAVLLFNILDQIGHPESQDCGNGITEYNEYMAGQLYITDTDGHAEDSGVDRVYHFCADGTLVGSWDVSAVADGVIGIATLDGTTFWLTTAGGEVVKCDGDFQEVARYSIPGYSGGGIDYDLETHHLYLIDRITGDVLVCDTAMNVLFTFDGHPTATNMVGVAVRPLLSGGRSVWTSTYGCTGPPVEPSIFEIEDEYANPVQNSSWGEIKDMYE